MTDGNLVRIPADKQNHDCDICKKKGVVTPANVTLTTTAQKMYRVCMECLRDYDQISEVIEACEEL